MLEFIKKQSLEFRKTINMQGYNTIYDTHSIQIQGGYLLLFHGDYNVN